jgi:hypothetical protein
MISHYQVHHEWQVKLQHKLYLKNKMTKNQLLPLPSRRTIVHFIKITEKFQNSNRLYSINYSYSIEKYNSDRLSHLERIRVLEEQSKVPPGLKLLTEDERFRLLDELEKSRREI